MDRAGLQADHDSSMGNQLVKNRFPISDKGGSAEDWIAVAEKVIRGKFLKAHKSTVESLLIGLRGNPDSRCQKAVLILKPK